MSDVAQHPYVYLSRLDRICAAALIVTVASISVTSSIARAFWRFDPAADAITVAYLVALAAVVIRPGSWQHAAAAMTGVLWWFSRGGAFAELVVTEGATNLIGSAVQSAVGGTVTVVTVHLYGLYRARRAEGEASRT